MKKRIFIGFFIGCVVLTASIICFVEPYFRSASLCRDIEAGQTEEAIIKIENMNDVNCGTAPKFMKPMLNVFEHNIDLPLVVACKNGNYQVAEKLLRKGADPNKYYEGGFTAVEAVFVSDSQNELAMIKLLANYGADVTKAESASSPLFKAARKMIYTKNAERKSYLSECIKYLLMFDKNLVDEKGISILHYAVIVDDISLTEQLLEEKQLINLTTDNGQTALFEAVKNNSYEAVKLLVNSGIEISKEDSTGRTAYDYAVERGFDDVALLLEESLE